MRTELLRISEALLTAGLNGILQGLLLLVLVVLSLRWFGGRMNATTRHAAYLVTLLFLVALIPANGLRHFLASRKPVAGDAQERVDRPEKAAPSAMTKPSRLLSYGHDACSGFSLRVLIAPSTQKAANPL